MLAGMVFLAGMPAVWAAQETPEQDLLARWTFDEAAGNTVYDVSGNGADATISTAHFSRVQGAAGADSKAVEFHYYNAYTPDNNDQRMNLKDCKKLPEAFYGKPAITVMAMVKKNWSKKYVNNDYHDLITIFAGNPTNAAAAFRVYLSDNGLYFAGRSAPGDSWKTTASVAVPQLKCEKADWLHVAVTADYANKKVLFYVNGMKVAEDTTTYATVWKGDTFSMAVPTANTRCHIGAPGFSLDDMSIWGRALTEEEIRRDIPAMAALNTNAIVDNGLADDNGGEDGPYLAPGKTAELVEGVCGLAVKSATEFRFDTNRLNDKAIGAGAYAGGLWFKGSVASKPYLWAVKIKNDKGTSANAFSVQLSDKNGMVNFNLGGRSCGADGFKAFDYLSDITVSDIEQQWHHVFAILDYSAGKGYLYLDGKLAATKENMGFGQTAYAGNVTRAAANVYDQIGGAGMAIADPVLYNRFVYADEVEALYQERFPQSYVSYRTADGVYLGDAPLPAGSPVTVQITVNEELPETAALFFTRTNGESLKEVYTETPGAQTTVTKQFATIESGDRLDVYIWKNMVLEPLSNKQTSEDWKDTQRLFVSSLFSDNMIVQRGKPFVIWGEGVNGSEVSVRFNGETKTAMVENRQWTLSFDNTDTLSDPALTVTDGKDRYTAGNLQLGQVFVLAGQSNMEWSVRKFNTADALTVNPSVYKYDMVITTGSTLATREAPGGRWEACGETKMLNSFSYLGYLFADKLQKQLEEPVAVIQTAVGGTQISSWLTRQSFQTVATIGNTTLQNHSDTSSSDTTRWKTIASQYNAKINPIGGYSVNGILWYQGEADYKYADYYYAALGKLVDDWRALWSRRSGIAEPVPFFVVQLPRYASQDYADIREAQWFAQFDKPALYTITAIDSGEETNIHPVDKTAVVNRLFGAVMTQVYQTPTAYQPAVYQSMTIGDSGDALLTVTGAGEGGLRAAEGQDASALTAFEVSADGETWVAADAEITGSSQITVHRPEGAEAISAVRYAWGAFPAVSVYNADGIPLAPFRTNSPYLQQN